MGVQVGTEDDTVTRLFVAGGFVGEIATWSPAVQALALVVFGGLVLVVVLSKSDTPTQRLIRIINALRAHR